MLIAVLRLQSTNAVTRSNLANSQKWRECAVAVDTALRVLELALLLDQHWTFHKMPQTLALVTHVAYNTIEFTKSMLEWLSESVMQTFDARR